MSIHPSSKGALLVTAGFAATLFAFVACGGCGGAGGQNPNIDDPVGDIATGGTYTFLTDDSGIGGGHLAARPTIGDYQVELLNDLMVRLVTERLAW